MWVDLNNVWISPSPAGSTPNTGYFGGGGAALSPATFSTMDKVTYASDTTAAVPGASLSGARYSLAASSARANALPATIAVPTPVVV